MRYIIALAALLLALPAYAVDVEFTLSWDAPTEGGPVDDYAVVCTDSSGATIVDQATAETSLTAAATVAEGAGECSLIARGPGGESDPVTAAFSVEVTAPPGPPQNFQITLDCTVVDGEVVCEQV